MMMIMLLSQVGVFSSIAYRAGLTGSARTFPWLVRDTRGIGITIAFVWKYFPYIGLSVPDVLQSVSPEYERQAATLGAGTVRIGTSEDFYSRPRRFAFLLIY